MPFDAARWQIDLMAADRTAQAFNSVNQRMKQTQQQAKAAGNAMSAGFGGAGQGINSLLGMIRPLVPAITAASAAWAVWNIGMKAGALIDQSEQLGLTVEQLQAYRFAAMQVGVSNEQLDASIMSLTRNMGAANSGSDEAIAKFDKLGVKLLDSRGELRKAADVMPEVARGLLNIESETERSALSMELFGKSGARVLTLLRDMAKGSDALVSSAKEQGTVVGTDVAEAWNKIDTRLKIVHQRYETLIASLAADVAIPGLEHILKVFESTRKEIEAIQKAWGWFTGGGAMGSDLAGMQKEAAEVQSRINKMHAEGSDTPLRAAALQREYARLGVLQDAIAQKMTATYELPPAVITGESGEKGKPTGKAAAKAAQSAADALAKAQREESEKVYKEILDNIDRMMKAGEAMTERFGNGAETLTRKLGELDEMLLMGAISTETYDAAVRDLTKSADDQNRAFIGAQGGFDAYIAGFDQGIADLQRANSEFEIGKKAVDFLGDSIEALAGISGKSFGEVAINFALMIAKMEAARAASQVWSAIGGFGGILSAIGLGGGGGGIPTLGGDASGFMGGSGIMNMGVISAVGGPVLPGQASTMGDDEIFVSNSGGNVLNRRQQDALGIGGGDTIIVNQTVNVGQYVTSTEYRRGLEATRRAAEEGAQAAMIARRRSGEKAVKGAFL